MKFTLIQTRTRLLGLLAAITLAVAGCGGDGKVYKYDNIVVFGASLSDTGNVFAVTAGATPGPAPYYNGRWSNGPLWIDLLAEQLTAITGNTLEVNHALTLGLGLEFTGGTNYAFGGAKTCAITGVTSDVPDMCDQVGMYLLNPLTVVSPDTLYVMDASAAGNAINTVMGAGGAIASTVVTADAPAQVAAQMQQLYDAGARRFLVVNVPNVGATPLYASYAAPVKAQATALSEGYNSALSTAVNGFITTNNTAVDPVYVTQYNIYATASNITANPGDYGLSNVTQACSTPPTTCATPESYFYWDAFHPTAAAGRIVKAAVLNSITY